MYLKITYLLFFIFLLNSCKKEKKNEIVKEIKIEEKDGINIIELDSTEIASFSDSLVVAFYKENAGKTFWISEPSREDLLYTLNNVEKDGLFKEDFDLEILNRKEDSIKKLNRNNLVHYDYLLTKNLIRYIKKVSRGDLNPKELYNDWELKEKKIDFKGFLLSFQETKNFEKALNAVRPNHIVYLKLKEALQVLDAFPDDEPDKIELEGKIVLNDTNPAVIPVKKRLIYWKDLKSSDSVTAVYDKETELAVQKFQVRHGLAVDGVVGIGTVNALNYSKEKRREQIIINMERWRWYPSEFEKEYIILNIPDYTLHLVKDNDTIRRHRIIVGKAARKTPILSSKLSHLVFNPTWTVPPTIKKNDIIPATSRNRNYLAQKNISVFDRQGNRISAADWDPARANGYRYVQSPGAYNALGLVKFMFPNNFMVYLHDTNSRGFFDKDIRALSSGCVRVQDPFELSEYVLQDVKGWDRKKIDETVHSGRTTSVRLNRDIYVHLFYWTAWSDNGVLQFRDDLYNLDVGLYEQLRN